MTQIPHTMISTVQISPEVYQSVLQDKINEASNEAQRLITTQQYDRVLTIYDRILQNIALLTNSEQRNYLLFSLIQNEQSVFQPVTELPRPEQDKWVEWLGKVQQFVFNFGKEANVAVAQNLAQIAEAYHIFGRTNLAAIAIQQATQIVQQIPEAINRANEFMQIARVWLQLQNKAQAKQALIQALSAVAKLPQDYPDAQWNYLFSIASLYIEVGEPHRALKLAESIANDYYLNAIRQEVVRDAVKRGDLHLAQSVTHKIQGAEYQAQALVQMAVYWANHHQVRRGNRLFAQALKRVAKDERAEAIQSTLIQTYHTTGQLNIALNAAQRLTQDEPKALALGVILVAYAKANQYQQVEQILSQLIGLIQSEAAINSVGYVNNILQVAVNAEQYQLAMTILNSVQNNTDFFSKPSWYWQIIQAQIRAQNLDAALELAQQIPGEFFPEERNYLLQEIAVNYANANQWHRAKEVLGLIENPIFISKPYHILTQAELAAIAPTPEEFTSLITTAIALTQAIEPFAPKVLALAAIAQAYLRFGNEAQSQFYLQQIIQIVQHLDDETRGHLLTPVTDYLIKQRQYTAALTIAQVNPVPHLQESSYSTIFQEAVAAYAFYVALQMVELETIPDKQAPRLIAIAQTYAQLQRHEDAITLLDRAFAVAQNIADPESRMLYINEYIQVPDESDRAHQYTRLVKQYFALGQQDKAQQVVDKTQGTSLRDYLQAWISC